MQKVRGKIIGQNKNNIVNFSINNLDYDVDGANELVDEAVVDNAIKTVSFNGKSATEQLRKKHKMATQILNQIPSTL